MWYSSDVMKLSVAVVDLVDIQVVHVVVVRSYDHLGFFGRNRSDLDLPDPIVANLLQLGSLDLLLNKFEWVWHISLLLLLLASHASVRQQALDLLLRVPDGLFVLDALLLHRLHLVSVELLFTASLGQLRFQLLQRLHDSRSVQFVLHQLTVTLLDLTNGLLVLNLQLMEVNELKIIAGLVLLPDRRLGFDNLVLEGHILQRELVDQGQLCLEFIVLVLHQLFSIVLASATVLGGGEETTEVKRLLPDLGDRQVRALKDGFETLQQGLGLLATLLNVLL